MIAPDEEWRTIRCTRVAESGGLTMEDLSRRPGDRYRSPTVLSRIALKVQESAIWNSRFMMTRSEFDRMLVIGLRGVFFLAAFAMLVSMIYDAWTFTPSSDVRFNRGTVANAIVMAVFVWVFLGLSLTLGKPEPEWNRATKLSAIVALAAQLGLGCAYAWLMFWP